MLKVLAGYVRSVESMHKWLGKVFSFAIFILMGIFVAEIIARAVLNTPLPSTIEMSQFVLGSYFIVGGGYVLIRGGHVKMDIFYSKWPARKKAIFDAATFFLPVVYLVVFIQSGVSNVAFSLATNQHSCTLWNPPLAPIKIIMVVGAGLLLLQVISFFIRDMTVILTGRELEGVTPAGELEGEVTK